MTSLLQARFGMFSARADRGRPGAAEKRFLITFNGITPVPVAPGTGRHAVLRLLAIGRLDPIKGFDRLIAQVAGLRTDFLLEIIGEGAQHAALQRQIAAAGLQARVRLCGYCTDIPQRMSAADVVVISSRSEGFPLVFLEALFYAKVLISTPVGDAAALLDPALVAPPEQLAQRLAAVAADYAAYQARFQAVREAQRDRFRMERVARQYEEFYRNVCESGNP